MSLVDIIVYSLLIKIVNYLIITICVNYIMNTQHVNPFIMYANMLIVANGSHIARNDATENDYML